jgi:23S rRNA pseudouridine1911/1915/1917 synthase
MGSFETRVGPGEEMRADLFLSSARKLMTRSQLKSRSALIRVNGKPVKPSRELREGDDVNVSWEEEDAPGLEAEDIPLSVLFEDDDVLVVDKAQGMVTHPANGNWRGTLVNAFLWRLKARTGDGLLRGEATADPASVLRPGIVHRLDKDTSGVIILAKTREAHAFLAAQFAARTLRKRYIAIVKGKPPANEGLIDTMLGRDRTDRKRFAVVEGRGKRALTRYRLVRSYGSGYSLLSLEPKTGRTHQLRVHLRHIGCPILGDPVYGRKDPKFPAATLMLHAFRLRILLPGGEVRTFTARLPPRFRAILYVLDEK